VLAHGAFERFVEGLALWALERVVDGWTLKKRATPSTASMLWYATTPSAPEEGAKSESAFDRIRKGLALEKQAMSAAINTNNGISIRHLQALFYRLGVNVPDDAVLASSLEKLVAMRHQWAHQYHYGAKVVTSAADAKKVVDDCLAFADRLASSASSARP
jgi:hypothetical protein